MLRTTRGTSIATSRSAADGEQVKVAMVDITGADDSRGRRWATVADVGAVRNVDTGVARGDMLQLNVCCRSLSRDAEGYIVTEASPSKHATYRISNAHTHYSVLEVCR